MLERTSAVHRCSDAEISRFAQILGGATLQIIQINVAIGADGIILTHLFAASVCQALAVRTPSQLFHTAEGQHGAFVRLTFKHITHHRNLLSIKFGHKRMRGGLRVVVPMFVHQVIAHHARSQRQVLIIGLNACMIGHFLHQYHFAAIGRKQIVKHIVGLKAELTTLASVHIHLPQLTAAALRGKISHLLAVFDKRRRHFTLHGRSEQTRSPCRHIHGINHAVAFVLLHAVIRNRINCILAIRRHRKRSDAPHGPKCFGRQHIFCRHQRGFTDE